MPLRSRAPKDLARALKRLDNAEIDALLAAVTAEAERRRGRLPSSPVKEKPTPDAKQRPRTEAIAKDGTGLLTTGKLNAVRAAFKAGVKPSAIARQWMAEQVSDPTLTTLDVNESRHS